MDIRKHAASARVLTKFIFWLFYEFPNQLRTPGKVAGFGLVAVKNSCVRGIAGNGCCCLSVGYTPLFLPAELIRIHARVRRSDAQEECESRVKLTAFVRSPS